MAKVQNLCVKETYVSNGVENTSWNQVGVIITKDDGKQFVKLHLFPNMILNVFDKKKKEKVAESTDQEQDEMGF